MNVPMKPRHPLLLNLLCIPEEHEVPEAVTVTGHGVEGVGHLHTREGGLVLVRQRCDSE